MATAEKKTPAKPRKTAGPAASAKAKTPAASAAKTATARRAWERAIDKEQALFNAQRADLMHKHKGEWALFKDGKVQGFFRSGPEAYADGIKRFGYDTVMLVTPVDEPQPECSTYAFAGRS